MIIAIIILAVVLAVAVSAGIALFIWFHNKTQNNNTALHNCDILEFNENNDTVFQIIDIINEYKNSKKRFVKVIVPSTHYAFISRDGVLSDILPPGPQEIIKNQNSSVKIIYISKSYKLNINWGTPPQMRVKYVDPKIGIPIDVGAFGKIEVQVDNPRQFYLEIISSFGDKFSIEDLQNRIRLKIVDRVTSSVRRMILSKQLSYYDFDNYKDELQVALCEELKDAIMGASGLRVCDVLIENMNITEENEQKIFAKYQKVQDEVEHDEQRKLDKKHEEERREDARSEREWKVETRPWDVQDQNWEYEDIDRANKFNVYQQGDLDIIHHRERARERDDIEYERKNRIEDEIRYHEWEKEDKDRDARIADYERKNRIEDETRYHEWEKEDKDRDARLIEESIKYDAVKAGYEAAAANAGTSGTIHNVGRHCRMCGSEYGTSDMFCPVCGAVTDRNDIEITCPKCQVVTTVKNKFCPSCGANLNEKS